MLYTSLDNKKIKNIKKLSLKKYRDQFSLFIVEGYHLVEEAYKAGLLKEVLIEENTNFDLDVIVNYVTKDILKSISNLDTPTNIIGICEKKKESDIKNRILILDSIQDPGNLGTIIRSSVAFNIDTIVLNNCVDLYNSKTLRSTQGMIFHINIIQRQLEEFINKLKLDNYKIYGTKVNGGKSIKNVEKVEKFAIIMGNEGAGVSKKILDLCDEYLYINMNKSCESLNVGIATSIILYELDKR
ncbi:MAG: RNA methyltransferase [bacterium]|nr:RNA methyltransferase [bacterium]